MLLFVVIAYVAPPYKMINRRPNARSNSSGDLEGGDGDATIGPSTSSPGGGATTTTTTNAALPTPAIGSLVTDGVQILPPKRTRRRHRRLSSHHSQKFRWQSYIPYVFVCAYIGFVVAGFTLLVRYLLWSSSSSSSQKSNNSSGNIALTSNNNNKNNNIQRLSPYPKIIRDPTILNSIQLSPEAISMCTKTLWHTIETTTIVLPHMETFIHTGDIDDLWIRDSAAQIHTLLIPAFGANRTQSLIQLDLKLDRIVSGLIRRVAMYIRHDPYANAFRIDDSYIFSQEQKKLGRHDLISTWNVSSIHIYYVS